MKHLLNTLYVTTQKSYLAREGETVVVRVDGETRFRVPVHNLGGIVCFGQVSCSPQLMGLCAERQVAVSFLSEYGRFWARVEGRLPGNVLLRREQYRSADNMKKSAEIARQVVTAKVANCRTVLLRAMRDHQERVNAPELQKAADHLGVLLKAPPLARTRIETARERDALEEIRGIEGDAARRYFGVFDHLITARKEDFFFRNRSRRPPLDNMNSLLSFLYTILAHDVASALVSVGLDPAVGFLHRDRPGRPGLALDLMEEMRPVLADRLALSLVNRQQVKKQGFRKSESGAILMSDETRKEVLTAYQKRKQEEVIHPFMGEKIAIGLIPFAQAVLLARYLRGDMDGYPPFFWK
ncbi:MAG: type I-C CRISPR-associated endonuclease Cas1c [Syntrophobacteraceae bacterium]